jgi:hypothetical protein
LIGQASFSPFVSLRPEALDQGERKMRAAAVRRSGHTTEQAYGRVRVKLRERHSDSSIKDAVKRGRRQSIRKLIKAQFGNGKWHSLDTIAEGLRADKKYVLDTISGMSKTGNFCCKVERKRVGTNTEFRFFSKEKTISSNELTTKLRPIVEGLKAEGKKNMATMVPAEVAMLAARLERLLNEWAE